MAKSPQQQKTSTRPITNDKPDTFEKKYEQLALDFEGFEESVQASKIILNDKYYLPREFVNHAFFLQKRSRKVTESRVFYQSIQKERQLRRKGLGEAEIKEQTKVKGDFHYRDFRHQYTDNKSGTLAIVAHIEWGLPDEFDGHVWDVLMTVAANIFKARGYFPKAIEFNPNMVVDALIKKRVFKGRGGRQQKLVEDSVQRLHHTSYERETGHFRARDGKEAVARYKINLISGIYQQGERLPDGSFNSSKMAVVFDPLLQENLTHQYYLIMNNERRQAIGRYTALALYDNLFRWGYVAYVQDARRIKRLRRAGVKFNHKIGYRKLCQRLGLEPREGAQEQKKEIKKQLKLIHQELIDNEVIDDYEVMDAKGEERYVIMYVYNDGFVDEIPHYMSKERLRNAAQLEERISLSEVKEEVVKVAREFDDEQVGRKLLK